jgi:hypothetical protein
MPYVPEKHDEFLTYERTLSYGDRVERLLAMQKKGLDHNDAEHRMSHEIEEHGYAAAPEAIAPPEA